MEGVTFALRDSLELMRPMVESIPEVRAIGGGARSPLWRQMQADVFGTPVLSLGDSGGPAYGAAIMAAVGAGMFDSIEQAADRWVSVTETTEPNVRSVPLYDELYQRYRELYPSLKAHFAHSAQPAGLA
jgi:xylulokinase